MYLTERERERAQAAKNIYRCLLLYQLIFANHVPPTETK